MGNCLVTKLLGSVNNDNLPVFGQVRIKATSATKVALWVKSSGPQTVKVLNPAGTVIDTQTLQEGLMLIGVADMSNYEYVTFVISDKYVLQTIYGHNTDTYGGAADSKYYIDIQDLSYSPIGKLQLMNEIGSTNNTIVLDGDNYEKPVILPNLENNIFFRNEVDNIGFLGGITGTYTKIQSDAGTTQIISGEWTDVLANMCKNGRTSGTIQINMFSDNHRATFNGITTGAVAFDVTFSSTGCTIADRIQWTQKTGYTSAAYNKNTNAWTFNE